MAYFVVISEQGPAWNSQQSMRDQGQWADHAAFMNALVDDGFVVLGGPIHGGARHQARLIVQAGSESEVRARLSQDPWSRAGLLQIHSIESWEVLLSKND